MSFQKTPSKDVPRLAVCWPSCDAETVHVTFARLNWETPGIALQRQSNGEFMCIMRATDPFDELLFKFIIDGTEWKINPTIPMILDEHGHENNRWTPSEATAYHDACVQRLQRRITLAHIDQVELCRLALSIHGQIDKDGRQLECVVVETTPDSYSGASLELSMSGLFNEIVFLCFQPLGGQSDTRKQKDQLKSLKNDGVSSMPKQDETVNETDKPDTHEIFTRSHDMDEHISDIWVAKFPADFPPHWLDGCKSNSERERRMESECATMRFLNEHTKIPAPQVYAYDVRYISLPDFTAESTITGSDPDIITENKIGWPFILMEKVEERTLLPYWGLAGDPQDNDPLLLEKNKFRATVWSQLATYQIELAKHPLAACGYLTLDCFKWQSKSETKARKIRTPKSAFGIRPCIYDACMPFTNSIVSAFNSLGENLLFQPARAFNSLNSVTARFEHFLTHGKVDSRTHFASLWQLRAMVYDIFGASHENGPFTLRHPDLSLQNVFVASDEDGHLTVSGLIDWEDAQAVPVQVAACPPGLCLGRLRYDGNDEPPQWDNLFKAPIFPESILLRHQHKYRTCMVESENHMAKEGHEPVIWRGFGGTTARLSQVLREEMVLTVYVLEELCSGSLYKPLTGDVANKYFPLIFYRVKGYEWEDVKMAVCFKGAMRLALNDWEEKQKEEVLINGVAI